MYGGHRFFEREKLRRSPTHDPPTSDVPHMLARLQLASKAQGGANSKHALLLALWRMAAGARARDVAALRSNPSSILIVAVAAVLLAKERVQARQHARQRGEVACMYVHEVVCDAECMASAIGRGGGQRR